MKLGLELNSNIQIGFNTLLKDNQNYFDNNI